ncbi:MAG: efflux RND transporter periplasmic adaptor subunit [Candidatus Competibacterales bacterium]
MIRWLTTVAVLAAIGAAFWYWQRPQPLGVAVATVERGVVEATVANTRAGTVEACRRSRLSPSVSGQVSQLHVHEGDRVEAGQLLLELWNEDLRAKLTLAERQRDASRFQTQEACLQAQVGRREADRLRPLREADLVSEEQLDLAETEAQARAAACRASRAREQVRVGEVALAQATLDRTLLKAPFAGVIAEVNGEVGEVATPSPPGIATPPAVDLIDCSCLYVSAPLDEVDVPMVEVGMEARITLDAFGEQIIAGRVRRIAPYVLDREKQARTVEVEVDFVDRDQCRALLPGYSADAEVILARREATLRLPSEAVLAGGRVLLLTAQGLLVERPFEAGIANWRYTEVVEGLSPGDRVVTSLDRPGVAAGVKAVAE